MPKTIYNESKCGLLDLTFTASWFEYSSVAAQNDGDLLRTVVGKTAIWSPEKKEDYIQIPSFSLSLLAPPSHLSIDEDIKLVVLFFFKCELLGIEKEVGQFFAQPFCL